MNSKDNIKFETGLSPIREREEKSYDEISDFNLDDSELFTEGNSCLDTEDDSEIIKKAEIIKKDEKEESMKNIEDESDTGIFMNLIICLATFRI